MLERLIKAHIMKHLLTNNLLSDSQYGFRPGRSCTLQMLCALDSWSHDLDAGRSLDVAYLDFSKAFDVVPHQKLLRKIHRHGITGSVAEWIQSFLKDRKQKVLVEGSSSKWQPVLSGVPQGSVLGPVLFSIYIKELPDVSTCPTLLLADDTKAYSAV